MQKRRYMCVCMSVCAHMCCSWPGSTVYVNKAPSWASIKPLSTQCLSLLETLMEICFCCRSSMSLLSPDGRREKGKVWMGLYSFMFQTVHAHTFAKSHTLLALLQWNQCSQFSSLCTASHSAKGFLWSNTTSCSATSDTDANTVRLLCSAVAVHSHCIQS